MADTFATRNFDFDDQKVIKGEDLSKREPKIPEQQIEDFRHCGLVGAKPKADEPAQAPAPKG